MPVPDGGDYRASPVRLFYVDDSGAPATGWVVYSWIECTITDWRVGLRAWLEGTVRRARYPAVVRAACRTFIGGQGNPSIHEPV